MLSVGREMKTEMLHGISVSFYEAILSNETETEAQDTSKESRSLLRSVMFMASGFAPLWSDNPYRSHEQLEAVSNLLELADSYVLNEATSVGGSFDPMFHGRQDLERDMLLNFFVQDARQNGAIEIISDAPGCQIPVEPYYRAVGLKEFTGSINAFEAKHGRRPEDPELDKKLDHLIWKARVVQQQAYVLIADRYDAHYTVERTYGTDALRYYPQLVASGQASTQPGDTPHEAMQQLKTVLAKLVQSSWGGGTIPVPGVSFLMEALRQSATPLGVCHTLQQLRVSKAAETYRELVRTMVARDQIPSKRQKAVSDLRGLLNDSLESDKMRGRVPQWIKVTLGVPSVLIGVVFPSIGTAMALLPPALELADYVDSIMRQRANLFTFYQRILDMDFYTELRRVFPSVAFSAEELKQFLAKRDQQLTRLRSGTTTAAPKSP